MKTRFVFVGNRRFVLEEMLEAEVHLSKVFVIKGTHLERDLNSGVLPDSVTYEVINSKHELMDHLCATDFDVLVSNGCPYILSISDLPEARYVNIHPSLLPDLRGYDPVIGAVLYQRDTGATCHIMDEGIDTGAIISQVHIPYTADLDVTTLYQLSFVAEKRAFREALLCDFDQHHAQGDIDGIISYKRREEDWHITFNESNEFIMQKIKAFNNLSQGCRFFAVGREFKVFGIQKMTNSYLDEIVFEKPEGNVVFSYEGSVVFHKDGEVLRLLGVVGVTDESPIDVGISLFRK